MIIRISTTTYIADPENVLDPKFQSWNKIWDSCYTNDSNKYSSYNLAYLDRGNRPTNKLLKLYTIEHQFWFEHWAYIDSMCIQHLHYYYFTALIYSVFTKKRYRLLLHSFSKAKASHGWKGAKILYRNTIAHWKKRKRETKSNITSRRRPISQGINHALGNRERPFFFKNSGISTELPSRKEDGRLFRPKFRSPCPSWFACIISTSQLSAKKKI